MTTITKDFRIKSGLAVESNNATVDGSDILTAASLDNGTQNNITVSYDAETKGLSFSIDALQIDAAGPLSYVDDTLDIVTGDGITVDTSNALAVNLDSSKGLRFDSGALAIAPNELGGIEFNEVDGTLQLEDAAANVGSFGSTTQIPSITVDDKGRVTAVSLSSVATNLSILSEDGSANVSLLNNDLVITGGEGVDVSIANNAVTISAELATDSNIGVASFSNTQFVVTDGNVVSNPVTIGTTSINLGGMSEILMGLQLVNTNAISATSANLSALFVPDSLSANASALLALRNLSMGFDKRIVNLADPVDAQDAATKAYVDAAAEGLHVKPSVLSATTGNLTATYDNGTDGVDATLTIVSDTLDIDGVTSWSIGDGILVKDQTNKFENGRYYVVQVGGVGTDWILKRCIACDEADEIPSSYVFAQGGTTLSATGWVALVENPATFAVGTDDIDWIQFSGAGTYLAGTNLDLNGTTFSLEDEITLTTVNANLVGNVTGNLTGNVSGATNVPLALASTSDAVQITAAKGISLTSSDGTILETDTYVGNSSTSDNLVATQGQVAEELDSYLNSTDGTSYIALTDYTDLAIQTGDATATPTYLALDINSVAKQIAAEATTDGLGSEYVVYSMNSGDYRSAKFLVKMADTSGHTQVSEVLLSMDTSNNIAITEYAVVGTSGSSLGDVSAAYDAFEGNIVNLTVISTLEVDVTVMGTLLA